jgi:hypothetical protein
MEPAAAPIDDGEPAAAPIDDGGVFLPEEEEPKKIDVVGRKWLKANAKAEVYDSEVPPGLDEQTRKEWIAAELERKRRVLVRCLERGCHGRNGAVMSH